MVILAALVAVTGLVGSRVLRSSKDSARSETPPASAEGSAEATPVIPTTPPSGASQIAARPSVEPRTTASAPAAPAASVRLAAHERTTESLTASLADPDGFLVVDAADELARRKATSALPALVALDIKQNPRSAPGVIDAMGQLADVASPAERQTATDRLLTLLREEKARKAPESPANILALYSALGQTHEARAATALEAELADPSVSLAAKTAVVDALVHLNEATSRAALQSLQRDLASFAPPDAFQQAVKKDLLAAVARALNAVP